MSRLLLYRLKIKDSRIRACVICEQNKMIFFDNIPQSNLFTYYKSYELIICRNCNHMHLLEQICKKKTLPKYEILYLAEYCVKYGQIDIYWMLNNFIRHNSKKINKIESYIVISNDYVYYPAGHILSNSVIYNSPGICRAIYNLNKKDVKAIFHGVLHSLAKCSVEGFVIENNILCMFKCSLTTARAVINEHSDLLFVFGGDYFRKYADLASSTAV